MGGESTQVAKRLKMDQGGEGTLANPADVVTNFTVALPDSISRDQAIEEVKELFARVEALNAIEKGLSDDLNIDVRELFKRVVTAIVDDMLNPAAEYMLGAVAGCTHGMSVRTDDGYNASAVMMCVMSNLVLCSKRFREEVSSLGCAHTQQMMLLNLGDALVDAMGNNAFDIETNVDSIADNASTQFLTTVTMLLKDTLSSVTAFDASTVDRIADKAIRMCIVEGLVITPDVVCLVLQALYNYPTDLGLSWTITADTGSYASVPGNQYLRTDFALMPFLGSFFDPASPAETKDFVVFVNDLASKAIKQGGRAPETAAQVAAAVTWSAMQREEEPLEYRIPAAVLLLAGLLGHGLYDGTSMRKFPDDYDSVEDYIQAVVHHVKLNKSNDLAYVAVRMLGACRGIPSSIDLINAAVMIRLFSEDFAEQVGLDDCDPITMTSEFFNVMPVTSTESLPAPVADTFSSMVAFYTGIVTTAKYPVDVRGDDRKVVVRDASVGDKTLLVAPESPVLFTTTSDFTIEVMGDDGEVIQVDLPRTSLGIMLFCVLFAPANPLAIKYAQGFGVDSRTAVSMLMSVSNDETEAADVLAHLHSCIRAKTAASKRGWVDTSDEDYAALVELVTKIGDRFFHSLAIAIRQAASIYKNKNADTAAAEIERANGTADALASRTKNLEAVRARIRIPETPETPDDPSGKIGLTASFVERVLVSSASHSVPGAVDLFLGLVKYTLGQDEAVSKCLAVYVAASRVAEHVVCDIENKGNVKVHVISLFQEVLGAYVPFTGDDDVDVSPVEAIVQVIQTTAADCLVEDAFDALKAVGWPVVYACLAELAYKVAIESADRIGDDDDDTKALRLIEDARTVVAQMGPHTYAPSLDKADKLLEEYASMRANNQISMPLVLEDTGSSLYIAHEAAGRISFSEHGELDIDTEQKPLAYPRPVCGYVALATSEQMASVGAAVYYLCAMPPMKKKQFEEWWSGLTIPAQAYALTALLRHNNCMLPIDRRLDGLGIADCDPEARATAFVIEDDGEGDGDVDGGGDGGIPCTVVVTAKNGKTSNVHLINMLKKMPRVQPATPEDVWFGTSYPGHQERVVCAIADHELFYGTTHSAAQGRIAGSNPLMRGLVCYRFLSETGGTKGYPSVASEVSIFEDGDGVVPTGTFAPLKCTDWKVSATAIGNAGAPSELRKSNATTTLASTQIVPALVSQVVSSAASVNEKMASTHAQLVEQTGEASLMLQQTLQGADADVTAEAVEIFTNVKEGLAAAKDRIATNDTEINDAADRSTDQIEGLAFDVAGQTVAVAGPAGLDEAYRNKRKRKPTAKAAEATKDDAAAGAAGAAESPRKRRNKGGNKGGKKSKK